MEVLIVVLLVVMVAAIAFVYLESRESRRSLESQLSAQRSDLQQRIDAMDQRLGQQVNSVQQSVVQSLSSSSQTLQQVTERLAGIDSAAKRIIDEVGPGISALQDVLKPPALRGGFGETLLEQLLSDVLPRETYVLQHQFRSGERVDAAIRLPEGLVPVDSKFPLEGLGRLLSAQSAEERERERRALIAAVRKHIDAVAKYIVPAEGTLPFALMYVPSESVYYEVMVRDEVATDRSRLAEYARQRNVFPVSPNTFYALLQAIAKGLRGLQIEERAREIINHLAQLQGDFKRFRDGFETLGQHIAHAKTKYEDLDRRIDRFGDRLARPLEAARHELPPGDEDRPES